MISSTLSVRNLEQSIEFYTRLLSQTRTAQPSLPALV